MSGVTPRSGSPRGTLPGGRTVTASVNGVPGSAVAPFSVRTQTFHAPELPGGTGALHHAPGAYHHTVAHSRRPRGSRMEADNCAALASVVRLASTPPPSGAAGTATSRWTPGGKGPTRPVAAEASVAPLKVKVREPSAWSATEVAPGIA